MWCVQIHVSWDRVSEYMHARQAMQGLDFRCKLFELQKYASKSNTTTATSTTMKYYNRTFL
jgi:hypothetical protein